MADEITPTELQSYSPQGLISQALAQNLPVETLERLMDLADRWEAKQAKSAFLKAMSIFQSNIPSILKTKKGHNNEYAPLPKITATIQPLLEECGLSYRWSFEDIEDKIKCTCIVSHIDGHSITDCMIAEKDLSGNKSNIHAIGSTRTYLQRYTLIGALGLSTVDRDDDGNKSTSGKGKDIPQPQQKDTITVKINKCETLEQLKILWDSLSIQEHKKYKLVFDTVKANIKKESQQK